MLYLAIDQHSKQLTVNLRDEDGAVVLKRQVSTRWENVRSFFEDIRRRSEAQGGYVAILEVCGFNDWLLDLLREFAGREIVLVQPTERSDRKTDQRDANQLGEILWVNRQRLLNGQRVQGLRRIRIVAESLREDRRLTMARLRTTRQLTRTINRIKHILRRHNLEQHQPTKGIQTRKAVVWLQTLELAALDRLQLDQLLEQWKLCDRQLGVFDAEIAKRCEQHPAAQRIGTLTGKVGFSSLALACRIEPLEDFATPRSLANYFGLAPKCNNSGNNPHRLGSITKRGSPVARYVLAQLVQHVLRRDPELRKWHRQVKLRRGKKVAMVAVMRRLTVVIWQMLKHQQDFVRGGHSRRTTAAPAQTSAK